ncbi:MAG: hypothetical protein KDE51_28075 [Anaerolineales bacterium]|nr:hypothetical protein [Anaerolineales bacterium]
MTISDDILFPQIVAWDNLVAAYYKAARGKRGKLSAAAFEHQLADRLLILQAELMDGSYRPGAYRHFIINEPKKRKISAAPFRDRVVHHALCNIIEPLFEARFHAHSYANRKGMGTHRAIDQLQQYARRYRYVLRLDIVQHFPSIDHALLKQTLFRLVDGKQTCTLIKHIIVSGEGVLQNEYDMVYFPGDDLLAVNRPRGLPIGNLTSQFWSNCYLNSFDWFVTRELGCATYLRYVDDFALFSNSKQQLLSWKQAIVERLSHHYRLTIHVQQSDVNCVQDGIPWLGFIIFPAHRRLKRHNIVQFQQRLEHNLNAYMIGQCTFAELDASVQGWINHVRYGDTWGLRNHIFYKNQIPTPLTIE